MSKFHAEYKFNQNGEFFSFEVYRKGIVHDIKTLETEKIVGNDISEPLFLAEVVVNPLKCYVKFPQTERGETEVLFYIDDVFDLYIFIEEEIDKTRKPKSENT